MADYKLVEVKDAAGVQLRGQMVVDGHRISTLGRLPEVTANNIHNMVNFPVRDDDVMFCSPPKSGISLK